MQKLETYSGRYKGSEALSEAAVKVIDPPNEKGLSNLQILMILAACFYGIPALFELIHLH